MPDRPPPPIPATCAARPVTPDGLVVPWGNVQLADGGVDFRSHHNARWAQCWKQGLCQVCGRHIPRPIVFLCGPNQLARLLFDEPPVHPECARYVSWACPMVAGDRAHYRTGPTLSQRHRGKTCPDPSCDCAGWVPTPGTDRTSAGGSAHEWYAVYAGAFHLAAVTDPDQPGGTRLIGGACLPGDIVRVRQVSEPGRALRPWRPVTGWLDRPPRRRIVALYAADMTAGNWPFIGEPR